MAFIAVPIHRQWTAGTPAPGSVAPDLVATLSGLQNAVWEEGQIGQHHGAALVASHEIRLKSGVIEVTFQKGAKVQFKGPVRAVLQNDNAAQLLSGKLVARVPKSAVGFAVETPAAVIVDLGTEFGAEVRDGHMETQVFVGEVMIQQPAHKGAATAEGVRVGAGQAVRVEATGNIKPAPFTSRSSFLPSVGFNNLALGKPIIDVSASWPGPLPNRSMGDMSLGTSSMGKSMIPMVPIGSAVTLRKTNTSRSICAHLTASNVLSYCRRIMVWPTLSAQTSLKFGRAKPSMTSSS